jgi:hypothetical protein
VRLGGRQQAAGGSLALPGNGPAAAAATVTAAKPLRNSCVARTRLAPAIWHAWHCPREAACCWLVGLRGCFQWGASMGSRCGCGCHDDAPQAWWSGGGLSGRSNG